MEAVSGVRLAETERERLEQLVKLGYYLNVADFLRDAVRSKLREFEFVVPRKLTTAKTKSEVLRIIKQKPNIYADEVASEIGIDIGTVINLIEELIKEKQVTA
ncbi:MAG: hypothetical protein HY516_01440 [Candidatus Aenigmarchaeota archaeon]|nr:hypothetical protein [Candidatus Aenigmarchaeota archaeon]